MKIWIIFMVLIILSIIMAGFQYWRWLSLRKSSEKAYPKYLFLFIAPISAVVAMVYIFPIFLVVVSQTPLLLVFLPLILVMALARISIRCKKKEGPYKAKDIEYYICDNKISNAWYDPKENKIFVSKDLVYVLEEDEVYAVLLHEKGHSKNKRLSILNAFLRATWIIIALFIAVTITSSHILLPNIAIGTRFALIAWLYSLGVVITPPILALSWIEEHEADLNALQYDPDLAEALIAALIKLGVSSRLSPYLNVSLSVNIKRMDIQEVRMRNVLKEFFFSVLFSVPITVFEFIKEPIYVTHPPTWLRAYCLKKYL